MIREDKWVNSFRLVSGVEKNTPSDRLSVSPVAADGKLAMPLHPVDVIHCHGMSKIVDGARADWASFAKKACAQPWSRKGGSPVISEDITSFLQLLIETSSSGKLLSFLSAL